MNPLTVDEVRFLLDLIEKEYGPGYVAHDSVRKVQFKLSIMLEMANLKTRTNDAAV